MSPSIHVKMRHIPMLYYSNLLSCSFYHKRLNNRTHRFSFSTFLFLLIGERRTIQIHLQHVPFIQYYEMDRDIRDVKIKLVARICFCTKQVTMIIITDVSVIWHTVK